MLSISTSVVLACLLAPQGDESEGPLVGSPHTFSVSSGTTGGTSSLSSAEIWFKEPGVDGAPPSSGVPSGRPDFRIKSILKGLSSLPDIASMSIGLDWILADDQGRLDIPTNGWGMLSLSFSPGSSGEPGSLLRSQATSDGNTMDLYTYIVPGSVGAPGWVDTLQRAQNNNEISVGGTGGNIDAHDLYIAGYRLAAPIVALLPVSPTFFFTIPKSDLAKIPVSTGWWGPPSSSPTPSGATILMSTWVPSPTGGSWTKPMVFLKYSDLTLAATEEIDALAVDPIRKRLILSTKTATRETLLVAIPTTSGIVLKDYVLQDGKTKVSKRLGMLKTDDVDAICAQDPGRGRGANYLQHTLGIPQPESLVRTWPRSGSVSVFRVGPNDEIQTWLNGWPRPRVPQPSIGILALTFPSLPLSPLIIVGQVSKPARSPFAGGPIKFNPALRVPGRYSRSGLPIQFNWLMVEQNAPGNYAVPLPAVIRL